MPPDQGGPDRLPPQSREAERSVLGSMLRDNGVIGDVVQIVRAENFYADAHQKIFQAHRRPLRQGPPGRSGHAGRVAQGTEADRGRRRLRLPRRAVGRRPDRRQRRVLRPHRPRQGHRPQPDPRQHRDPARRLRPGQPADELLGAAERKILDIAEMGITGQTFTLQRGPAARPTTASTPARSTDHMSISGLPTGYHRPRRDDGGLAELRAGHPRGPAERRQDGLRARTSSATSSSRRSMPVFFVSLEQSRIELAERLLCCQARVDSHKLRKGHLSSRRHGQADRGRRRAAQGQAVHRRHARPGHAAHRRQRPPAEAAARASSWSSSTTCSSSSRTIAATAAQEQVAQISRRLKFLARELKIPVVALAQVNRASGGPAGPPAAAGGPARIAARIEQDADTVMMLHRPEMYEPGQHEGIIEVIIAKQRNGPTGEVTLTYLKQFMRFENFAVEHAVRATAERLDSRCQPRRLARYNPARPAILASRRQPRMRVGIGHDTHRLAEGRPLILGGVPHRASARPGRPQRCRRRAARRHRRPARRRRPGRHRRRLSRHRPGLPGLRLGAVSCAKRWRG